MYSLLRNYPKYGTCHVNYVFVCILISKYDYDCEYHQYIVSHNCEDTQRVLGLTMHIYIYIYICMVSQFDVVAENGELH